MTCENRCLMAPVFKYGMLTRYRFRLGTPTRELYFDGIGYECCFTGQPIQVRFGDVLRSVSLVGREPGKDIGKCKRTDLVAGKINIIIDEEFAFPVFLDSKPQR